MDLTVVWVATVTVVAHGIIAWRLAVRFRRAADRYRTEIEAKAEEWLRKAQSGVANQLKEGIDWKAWWAAVPVEDLISRFLKVPEGQEAYKAAIDAVYDSIRDSLKGQLAGKNGAERVAAHRALGSVVAKFTDSMGVTPILAAVGLDPKKNPTGVIQIVMQLFGPQIQAWLEKMQGAGATAINTVAANLINTPGDAPQG